jgi:ABC-type nitrate/sulfonate/bicarbonate transport system substrate-binding protein
VYAAQKLGYFKDEGLDVDIVTISGTAPMFAGVESGSAQFGITNGLSLLTGIAKGLPFVAFAGTDHGFSVLNMVASPAWAKAHNMSLKDDYRTTLRKLVGARIGLLGTTSTGGLLLAALAKQMGLPDDAYQMVAMGPPASLAALSNGSIDAYLQGIPPTGGVYVLNSGQFPGIQQVAGNVVFTTADFITKHPEIVAKMARAVARGANAALDAEMQPRVLQLVNERIPEFSIPEIKTELLRPGVPMGNGQLVPGSFALANAYDAKIGLLDKPLTPEQLNASFTMKFVPKTYIKP